MSKKKEVQVFSLAVVLVLLLTGLFTFGQPVICSAAEEKPVELALSLSIVEMNDRWLKVMKPWVENIQKESQGRIVIHPYFVGTLAKETQNYQGLVDGLIDLSYASFVTEWGRFPMTEIMLVSPPGGKMYTRPSRVLWEMYSQFPEFQKEYAEVKLLSLS